MLLIRYQSLVACHRVFGEFETCQNYQTEQAGKVQSCQLFVTDESIVPNQIEFPKRFGISPQPL
jgi:hypothetical protein